MTMPTSSQQPESHRAMSLWYPRDHVFGALSGRSAAEKAAQALRDAGFASDDVAVFHPEDADQHVREAEGRRGFFKTFLAAWDHLSSDEGGAMRRYQRASANGLEVIMVYAPQKESARRAAALLRTHGAAEIWYYRRWTVEEL
jgi:hypothetical protein